MSSGPISPVQVHGKAKRTSSILGASKKVVKSAVRRPLRAVGRAVSHKRDQNKQSRVGDVIFVAADDEGLELGEEVILEANSQYGSIIGIPNGNLDCSTNAEGMPLLRTNSSALLNAKNNPDWPVHSTEQMTRTLLLCCTAYLMGCKYPQWSNFVGRTAEYAGIAWITCLVILSLSYVQTQFPQCIPASTGRQAEEGLALLTEQPAVIERPPRPTPKGEKVETPTLIPTPRQISTSSNEDQVSLIGLTSSMDESQASATPTIKLSHPAMSCLYVIDANSGERIYLNTLKPTHISTEWFEMDMMVLVRTPDVDDANAEKGPPCNDRWVDYFRQRQRRFEFQYQLKLKKVPKDKAVYFACELEDPIKMGIIQRAFVGAAMAFMKSTNPTFHYSVTGSKERTPDGKYEKPHMSFTVEGSLDRLVITKPGETPPELGTAIEEDPESMKRRKKGIPIDWNTEDIYTMALWSAYVDFIDWRVINLPGIRPFGLSSVLGSQPFCLTMYLIDAKRDNDKHYEKDITNVVKLELCNDRYAEKGRYARIWTKEHERKQKEQEMYIRMSSSDQEQLNAEEEDGNGQELQRSKSLEDNYIPEEADDDDDAETAAELGEGIYLRSGDCICLREFIANAEEENTKIFSVASGGGFAVMQEQDVTIVIEKTRRAKKHRLIKSGDTVTFKMIQKKAKETETRYLSIHRGWWLKWVSSVPSKNGFFTIYAHDTDFGKNDQLNSAQSESQTSYLNLGGPFILRHKRWSNYYVGVADEPSPTYGGRMLGLYNPKSAEKIVEDADQSDEPEQDDADQELKGNKPKWMQPLVLTGIEPPSLSIPPLPLATRAKSENTANPLDEQMMDSVGITNHNALVFSGEHAHADVPAWIETMNRRDRVRQLTYVVRVNQPIKDDQKTGAEEKVEDQPKQKCPDTFIRLRTGRELAKVMRVGQRARGYVAPHEAANKPSQLKQDQRQNTEKSITGDGRSNSYFRGSSKDCLNANTPISGGTKKSPNILTLSPRAERGGIETPLDFSFDADAKDDESDDGSEKSLEGGTRDEIEEPMLQGVFDEGDVEVGEELELESELETEGSENEVGPDPERRKKRGVMGKSKALLGKSVKATAGGVLKTAKLGVKTTKLTGKVALATGKLSAKAVVGAGKLTGKAVNAGKSAGRAVIAPVSRKSRKPPKAEPKAKLKDSESKSVAKTMKKMARIERKAARVPTFLAGELCAPEQSRETASRILSRMSSAPLASRYWKQFNTALTSQIDHESDQDRWFLEGTSVELGVTPLSGDKSRGRLVHESLVARCLWESHWREEWCGVYGSCVSLYSPLSKSPCIEIAYVDITNVRPLDAGSMSPLPGFPLLVLETAWLCHYMAFRDEESRDTFGEKLESAIEIHIKQVEESASLQEDDLRNARFWQGFQSLSESSLSSGIGKWAKITIKDKSKERAILNGRRMVFDSHTTMLDNPSNGFEFVEQLLSRALSFSLESLEKDPASFVEFLDLTTQLRTLPLHEMDLSSKSAFCLFANLYHCLLQQAMLLSVNGPLHKKNVVHFMRTACFEIGGDVFSLAELYCCVLRGKMNKPINPKPPYLEAPKKSQPYRNYAVDFKDPRVNFVLHTGDVACPRTVPILRAEDLEEQLNEASSVFLKKELVIDPKRRVVILPKVCEVYKNDFGGDAMSCLKFCMGGLDEMTVSTIQFMMMDAGSLILRYQHAADQYYTSLKLRVDKRVEEPETAEGGFEF